MKRPNSKFALDLKPHSPAGDLTFPWWVVTIPGALFVILGLISRGPDTLNIDLNVTRWIQERSATWSDPLATFGNTIGETYVAISVVVVLLILSTLKNWRREIWFLLVAAMGRLLAVFLKGIFDSPRPFADQANLAETYSGNGFPSGHVFTSTIVAGAIAFTLARQFQSSRSRALIGVLWLFAIVCTAFARIWVGAHWFTDTIGGALFGVFVILLAANLSAILIVRLPGSTPKRS